jgi:hypothetical protein
MKRECTMSNKSGTDRPLIESVGERVFTAEDLTSLGYISSPGALAVLRHRGKGPRGVRVGRRILYPEGEVLLWLNSNPVGPSRPGDAA